MKSHIILNRRQFIQGTGLVLVGSCFMPKILHAEDPLPEKRLNLYNIHTGESFNDVFWSEEKLIPEAVTQLNNIMRDWRTDSVKDINPLLYLLVHRLSEKLDTKKPIEIISGYRCPQTNQSLRKKSKGVAKQSRHLTGNAIDFSLKDRSMKEARRVAMSFKAGGVGYYPSKGFIHMDIRDKPTYW